MSSLGCYKVGFGISSGSNTIGRGYIYSEGQNYNLEGPVRRSTSPFITNGKSDAVRELDFCSRSKNIYPPNGRSLLFQLNGKDNEKPRLGEKVNAMVKLDGKAMDMIMLNGKADGPGIESHHKFYDDEYINPDGAGTYPTFVKVDGQAATIGDTFNEPLVNIDSDIVDSYGLGSYGSDLAKAYGEVANLGDNYVDDGLCLGHPVDYFQTNACIADNYNIAATSIDNKKDMVVNVGMVQEAKDDDVHKPSIADAINNDQGNPRHLNKSTISNINLCGREQALKIAEKSKANFSLLEKEVQIANDMLEKMDKKSHQISDEIMVKVKNSLVLAPDWLMTMLNVKNQSIDKLYQDLHDYEKAYQDIADERDELVLQLELEKQQDKGLNPIVLDQLKTLGFSNVHQLINGYMLLQAQTEKPVDRRHTFTVSRIGHSQHSLHKTSSDKVNSKLSSTQNIIQDSLIPDSINVIKGGNASKAQVHLPMPKAFNGKTRVELERWYRYFDAAVESRGYADKDKAVILGNYVPKLQFTHDKLMKRNASYEEIKLELLNALGSDSSIRTFTIRAAIDRIKKPNSKTYKVMLEELEQKVAEAYTEDNDQGEAELKKILIRLVQEDSNTMFSAAIIPHLTEGYYRLKELVIGIENSIALQSKTSRKFATGFSKDNLPKMNSPSKFSKTSEDEFDDRNLSGQSHMQKASTVLDSSSPPMPLSPASNRSLITCYKCNRTGHYASDCSHTQNLKTVKKFDDVEMMGILPIGTLNAIEYDKIPLFGRKAMLNIYIDHVKVNAMLDSGACASVISESALGKILRERKKFDRKIFEENPNTWLHTQLVSANGTGLKVSNCVRMPISWGIYPPKVVKFFVVAELQQDVLIGTNVLQNDQGWMEALKYALKTHSTKEKDTSTQQNASVGLILPHNDIQLYRDNAFNCTRDTSRRYCNVKSYVKNNVKERKFVSHQNQKMKQNIKQQDSNPLWKKQVNYSGDINSSQGTSHDYRKMPKMLNGRMVFYNQSYYRSRETKLLFNRGLSKTASNEKERTSNVRDFSRKSSTSLQHYVKSAHDLIQSNEKENLDRGRSQQNSRSTYHQIRDMSRGHRALKNTLVDCFQLQRTYQ